MLSFDGTARLFQILLLITAQRVREIIATAVFHYSKFCTNYNKIRPFYRNLPPYKDRQKKDSAFRDEHTFSLIIAIKIYLNISIRRATLLYHSYLSDIRHDAQQKKCRFHRNSSTL